MISPDPIAILLLAATATAAAAAAGGAVQAPSSDTVGNNSPSNNNIQVSFRPSIAVVIGIFSIMFFVTFLLLMYAKFCHSTAADLLSANRSAAIPGVGSRRVDAGRSSGIDKAVIESLPFFSFSALRGSREGLECAVCLSRFDDAEILRLLPRCKHAFHLDCIDRWLDSHSSCPLCRTRVDIDDVAFFKYSASSHYLFRDPSGRPASDAVDDSGEHSLELYVEREHAAAAGSTSRLFASIRWAERIKSAAATANSKPVPLHNIKHRIVVSDVVFRSRWSDFNSADLISLDTEMLRVMSSKRFDLASGSGGGGGEMEPPELPGEEGVSKIKEEMEKKRRLESKAGQMNVPERGNIPLAEEYSIEYSASDMRALISPASRCMSDITEVSRYRPSGSRGSRKEEKVRQMWLPIARRTVQWFAGKERRTMLLQPQSREDAEENV